jgi:hypothetical protein
MSTKLDQLLQDIDPSRTIDETYARADSALNSFSFTQAQITDWHKFHVCIARLVCHIRNTVLRLRKPLEVDVEFEWGQAVRYLHNEYGPEGEKAAFQKARTGNEGGLYSVLKVIAKQMAEEYSTNEIRARISNYLNQLTVDERLDAADEYLKKFGHLLPSEVTEGYPVRVKGFFHKFLEEHPKLIRNLRLASR